MFVLLMTLAGCDTVGRHCTKIGAPDSFTIDIVREEGWTGDVTTTISGEDESITCELPAGETDQSCLGDEGTLSVRGDTLSFSTWYFTPDSVTVVVLVDGTEVVNESVTPTYIESEPNGEGCGVTLTAQETIEL